jgi:antitoxin HigA-1
MTTEELKMSPLLDEIHPGETLLEDFMKPMGITAHQLAADIDVSPSRISDLLHGNPNVTADAALRLGLFFNIEPRFWLNLQTEYDMRQAARTLADAIAPRIRVFQQPASAGSIDSWMPSGQQRASVFVPKHQGCVVAFPHAAIAAAAAARGGLGRRFTKVVACGLQARLKLRNAPAYSSTLGREGVDDGVGVVHGHGLLSGTDDHL